MTAHDHRCRRSHPVSPVSITATLLAALASATVLAAPDQREDGHPHGAKHGVVFDQARFLTDRSGAALPLPEEEDAFFFAIFGDRTGGPPEGVEVLADAVRDVNVLEPDLVMTVGDLVEGYNQRDEWMVQMREFRGIMDELLCPWFPVAGNHDIYWRGPNRPPGEHETDYETYFGPLWYAFAHKESWFIVLYSDEGDPVSGRRAIADPAAQVMSDAQLGWLRRTLARTRDADHVFVFLHHPRWLRGGYGDDWDRVHTLLADAGNVDAVFAGHIHHMRYDGPRDGIEYVTLATVGGVQNGWAPEAGYLHQFHLVTVRPEQIAIAAVPVGEVMDVRAITGDVSVETRELARMRPDVRSLPVDASGGADDVVRVVVSNPVDRPIDVTLSPDLPGGRWSALPDHDHAVIEPGDSHAFAFHVRRVESPIDDTFRFPHLVQRMDYLARGFRVSIPERRWPVPVAAWLEAPDRSAAGGERVLVLDGRDDCLAVASERVEIPDGPLTIECWLNANAFGERVGLVTKTESSEYGLFANGGVPAFYVFLDDAYVEVKADGPLLRPGTWHHVAGVHDGAASRLYVDGRLVGRVEGAGPRRVNTLPLIVGGDVNGQGVGVALFDGAIDGVRLSRTARYERDAFAPARRHEPDDATVLLLDMDGRVGPWLYDGSGRSAHPVIRGDPEVRPEDG